MKEIHPYKICDAAWTIGHVVVFQRKLEERNGKYSHLVLQPGEEESGLGQSAYLPLGLELVLVEPH
jgi:hypothetical protein